MENEKLLAAGVLVKSNITNKVLLLLRNDEGDVINTWGLVSGGIDEGEDILTGLKREVTEEMQVNPDIIDYNYIHCDEVSEKDVIFHYYEGYSDVEFTPTLDYENLAWGWFDKDNLPEPLYPGILNKIKDI
jgi:8-oxo-dGTP pyrophosphatase MutT (NUDIX family)